MIESATHLQQATLGTLFTWAVTAAGSGCVYLIPNAGRKLFDAALGFSAGVMLAASYWEWSVTDSTVEFRLRAQFY